MKKREKNGKGRFAAVYREVHSAGPEKRIVLEDRETGEPHLYLQVGYGGA